MRQQNAKILPDYDAVIFDECHTLESVASDHLGISFGTGQVEYTLRKLYNPKTDKGLLVTLGLKQLAQDSFRCMESLDDLSADLAGWLERQTSGTGRVKEKHIVENSLSGRLRTLAEQLLKYGGEHKDSNVRQDMTAAHGRLTSWPKVSISGWSRPWNDRCIGSSPPSREQDFDCF